MSIQLAASPTTMFSLLLGFWRHFFAKVQYQILILGLDNAGKTTLLEQLRHRYNGTTPPSNMRIPPTVGLNICKLDIDRTRLVFWDLGGQSGLRTLWDKYFSDAHALIYVMDSCDEDRLAENAAELEKLLSDPELDGVPLLLLTNKQDADGALSEETLRDEMSLPARCLISRMPTATSSSSSSSAGGGGGGGGSSSSTNPFASSLSSLASHAAQVAVSSFGSVMMGGASSLSAGRTSNFDHDANGESDERPVHVQGVSALSGAGVENGLRWLLHILPTARRTRELIERAESGGGGGG